MRLPFTLDLCKDVKRSLSIKSSKDSGDAPLVRCLCCRYEDWVCSQEPREWRKERQPIVEEHVCSPGLGKKRRADAKQPMGELQGKHETRSQRPSRTAWGMLSIPLCAPAHICTCHETQTHTNIHNQMFYSLLLCIINPFVSLKNLEEWNSEYGLNVKYYLIPLNNNKLPSSRTPKIFTKEMMKIPTGKGSGIAEAIEKLSTDPGH